MWLRIIRRALATTVLCILCDASQAANVTYSWSGNIGLIISLSGGDIVDPWMIGVDGQPFELSAMVSVHADDIFDQNIRLSGYSVSDATLTLNGESIEYLVLERAMLGIDRDQCFRFFDFNLIAKLPVEEIA